jgi:periplasmic copper chaperone A
MMRIAAAALLATAIAAPAAAREVKAGDLTLSGLEMRASLGNNPNTAAYFVIANRGARADRLMSVSCACAARVAVHATETTGGVSRMKPAGPIIIPAGGRAVFAPGAYHLMVTGLKTRLADGAMQELTLRFERAGAVRAGFNVRARIGAPAHRH